MPTWEAQARVETLANTVDVESLPTIGPLLIAVSYSYLYSPGARSCGLTIKASSERLIRLGGDQTTPRSQKLAEELRQPGNANRCVGRGPFRRNPGRER